MRPCGDKCGSMLLLVRACCLTIPWYYLNQCWLLVEGVRWHSPEINFTMTSHVVFGKMGVKFILLKFLPHLTGSMNWFNDWFNIHIYIQAPGYTNYWRVTELILALDKSDGHLLGTNAPMFSLSSQTTRSKYLRLTLFQNELFVTGGRWWHRAMHCLKRWQTVNSLQPMTKRGSIYLELY